MALTLASRVRVHGSSTVVIYNMSHCSMCYDDCVCVYSSASVIVIDLGNLEITSSSKEFVVRLQCVLYGVEPEI